jgi:class 3 adenylate cyclase/predicted hydrocarbon binding protein
MGHGCSTETHRYILDSNGKKFNRPVVHLQSANNFSRKESFHRTAFDYETIVNNPKCTTLNVPEEFNDLFKHAENLVTNYFSTFAWDPKSSSIQVSRKKKLLMLQIQGDRYILVRGPSLTVEFHSLIKNIIKDEKKSLEFVRNLLFDLAHSIGKNDAKFFNTKTNVHESLQSLSSGPIMFAFTGWAFVTIHKESRPVPNEKDFLLVVDHPFSFEADAYAKQNLKYDVPMCAMSGGYAAGWYVFLYFLIVRNECAFGIKCAAKEILCKVRGDETCRFIVSHPDVLDKNVREYKMAHPELKNIYDEGDIPGFFERRSNHYLSGDAKSVLDELKTQNMKLQEERKQVFDLLNNILPETVVKELSHKNEVSTVSVDNVTILFADVVGFTQVASRLNPEEVLNWLDNIFLELDNLGSKYGIEKIKTIGDAYMCGSGILTPRSDHLEIMVQFAIEALSTVQKIKVPGTNEPVSMRIGIHTGPCVCRFLTAGKKFILDVFGDVVNVASRMESYSDVGMIQVTETVYEALKHTHRFIQRKKIAIKGKGLMQTYFIHV